MRGSFARSVRDRAVALALSVTGCRHRVRRQRRPSQEARPGDAQRIGCDLPARLLPSGHRRVQAGSRRASRSTTAAVARARAAGLHRQLVDFAGTDAVFKPDGRGEGVGAVLLLPDGGGPDHGVVQPRGREGPEPVGRHHRQDLPARRSRPGTTQAIKAENPKAKLPSTAITVARRSDSSGTTENFTTFLTKAAPERVDARQGLDRARGRPTPRARAATRVWPRS